MTKKATWSIELLTQFHEQSEAQRDQPFAQAGHERVAGIGS
jgi:hypothetical protein